MHHFQRISAVPSEYFPLKHFEPLPVHTVLSLPPGRSTVSPHHTPMNRENRRQDLELVSRDERFIHLTCFVKLN